MSRSVAVGRLLAVSIASGAVAALIAAGFIWVVESGTEIVWHDLPDRLGAEPFESWWLFAIPIGGGLLVGLGQRFLGNYPEPLERVISRWRSGGAVDPHTMPATGFNAVVALVAGGPVGFEAALTGLIGGAATGIGARIRSAGHLLRQAWGAERIGTLPGPVRRLPYWLAAVSGLLTYRWLPFGQIDMSFRLADFDGEMTIREALIAFGFAAAMVVPFSWAAAVVVRAEAATFYRRSPVLVAMAGGLAFALLAVGNHDVLFSGQQGTQSLGSYGTAELLFLAGAKWLALVVALFAGWRGGPIFPMFFSAAALALAADGVLDVAPDLLVVAGLAAVSAIFLKGSVPAAFVLTLYVAPFSFAGPILVGALGAATALALARPTGLLPRAPERFAPTDAPEPA